MRALRLNQAAVLLAAFGSAAPALAQEGPLAKGVSGRDAALEAMLRPVAERSSRHVVALSKPGQGRVGFAVVIAPRLAVTAIGNVPSSLQLAAEGRGYRGTADVHRQLPRYGLALLRLDGDCPPPAPVAANVGADGLEVGSFLVSVGSEALPLAAGVLGAAPRQVSKQPGGMGGDVFTQLFGGNGGTKGRQRDYPSVLHHDSPLEGDEFGSGLFDRRGHLVGINVAVPCRGSAFAVDADTLRKVAELQLPVAGQAQPLPQGRLDEQTTARQEPQRPETNPRAPEPAREQPQVKPRPVEAQQPAPKPAVGRAWLGFSALPKDDVPLYGFGLVVNEVAAGGPAAQAGLKQGDVVVTVGGETFASLDDFGAAAGKAGVGDLLELEILRDSRRVDVTLKVAARK